MTAPKDLIASAIVHWLRNYSTDDVGVDGSDAAVLPATCVLAEPINGPRPTTAHISFWVRWPGRTVGSSYTNGNGVYKNDVSTSVRITAYGDAAAQWLAAATSALDARPVIAALATYGVTLRPPLDGFVQVDAYLETEVERRATADFPLTCAYATRPVTPPYEAEHVSVSSTFEGSTPLDLTISVDLE